MLQNATSCDRVVGTDDECSRVCLPAMIDQLLKRRMKTTKE
ncbi:hypothetical protein LBWT_X3460 (plasmid) [Leptolyngbya boryana IAM M-101]|nr:hypothetical protein LBWT_X3460 [Leptolyngbya boryana IAM M-101]BAS66622.1 hypothetical protein LBDG_X3460 [Leptolyngbya boryana dg5]